MSSYDPKPIETIRMDERERRRVLDEFSARHKPQPNHGPKRDIRVAYSSTQISVSIANPGGNVVTYSVIPRNLSRRGVGFLHGRFVYPHSRCQITLHTLDSESMTLEGTVVRCQHLGGTIHEVGAVFSSPIDLTLFTELKPEELEAHKAEYENDVLDGKIAQTRSERGKVLIVDENKLDRKLVAKLLEREWYSCRETDSRDDAMGMIKAVDFDLIVVDCGVDDASGIELINHLNGAAFKGAILTVSVDDDEELRQAALVAGARKFLTKPINTESFGKLVNLMLGQDQDGGALEPIISTLSHDEGLRPLLRDFTNEVRSMINELRSLDLSADPAPLRMTCRKLVGTGGSYGYDEVRDTARGVLTTLSEAGSDPAPRESAVNRLIQVLSRVRAE